MWTSLCSYLCEKLFSKQESPSPVSQIRESASNTRLQHGKRLRLADSDMGRRDSVASLKRLPMQTKENVDRCHVENQDCFAAAELPRRRKGNDSHFDWASTTEDDSQRNRNPWKTDSNREIEIVKCLKSGTGKKPVESSQSKNFKIFTTQRSHLSQSKSTKSKMMFRSQLKKKLNLLQENYRLTEKYQYIQLLQTQTANNLFKSAQLRLRQVKPAVVPLLIDLTEDKHNNSGARCSLVHSAAARDEQPVDQDVQIIKEIPRVRSLEDILKLRPIKPQKSANLPKLECKSSKSSGALFTIDDFECETIKLDENNKKIYSPSLEAKLQSLMQITEPEIIEIPDRYEDFYLPALTCQQEERIQAALVDEPADEVLVQSFGISITRRDMQTLKGLNWLNDEVINFYMNLIVKRREKNQSLPKVYAFNTFFFTKLFTNGYPALKRWTKQVDIFSFDMILVPIHLGMHWCLSTVDFRKKQVNYYDSVGSPNEVCLEQLLSYLELESWDKRQVPFPTDDWTKNNVKNIPHQMNGSDCGVFCCMFAEYLTRDCPILFTQDDMPYFRKKMVVELLDAKLLT